MLVQSQAIVNLYDCLIGQFLVSLVCLYVCRYAILDVPLER